MTVAKTPASALRAGSSFTIPEGNSELHGMLTSIYYYEHDFIDENEIVVLEREGLSVRARITGMTTDVNSYDGSKPRTRVVVEADFSLSLNPLE